MTLESNNEHQPTIVVQEKNMETTAQKIPASKIRRTVLITLALLIIGGGTAFFFSARGLSEEALSQVLDAWIESQEAKAKADGTEVDIAYEKIALEGGFGNQSVVMYAPSIKVAPKGVAIEQAGAGTTVFRTAKLVLYPEDVRIQNVRIEAPDTLEVLDGSSESPRFKIMPNTPLMLSISHEKEGKNSFVVVNHYLPNVWNIEHLREQEASGEEEQTPTLTPVYDAFTITLNEGGQYKSRMLESNDLGEGFVKFSGLNLADASGAPLVSIANMNSEWKGVVDDNDQMLQSFSMNVENFDAGAAMPELEAYAPMNLAIHANVSAPAHSEHGNTMILAIENASLSMSDTALSIRGGFSTGGTEMLPLGNADIEVMNLARLLELLQRDGLLAPSQTKLAADVAQAVLGEPADLSKTVKFSVSRAQGAGFMIGKVPLEALIGTVLKSAMEGVTIHAPKAP